MLFNPVLPLLQLRVFVLIPLVVLEIPEVALVRSFPLIELSVDGQVGLLEVLFLVAFVGSRRIDLVIGVVKLRQVLPIAVFIHTVLLIPLGLLSIVQFVWERQIHQDDKQRCEVQYLVPALRIEVDNAVPDDISDDVDEEGELEQGQAGFDREEVDVDGVGGPLVDVVLV